MNIKELLTSALKHSLVFIGSVGVPLNKEATLKKAWKDYLWHIEGGKMSEDGLVDIADELVESIGELRSAKRFSTTIPNHRQLARELRELIEQTDGCNRNRGNFNYMSLYAVLSLKRQD